MDKSGIYSQKGFVFQIQVFMSYAAQLQPGSVVRYEYLDDVSKQSVYEDLDGSIRLDTTVYQVKLTKVNFADVVRLYTNWICALHNDGSITKFVLVLGRDGSPSEAFSDLSAEQYLEELQKCALLHPQSIFAQVNNQMDKEEIVASFELVRRGAKEERRPNIDDEIASLLKSSLHYGSVENGTYNARIEELRGKIIAEITESLLQNSSYSMSFEKMMTVCEEVCQGICDNCYAPSFHAWMANHPSQDLEKLANKRERIQLGHCFDNVDSISRHIYYCDFYASLRYRKLENSKKTQVLDLEGVTYGNFEDVKYALAEEGNDTPLKRLTRTKSSSNLHCVSDEERWGSCIYLTKEDTPLSCRISWKDD